MNYEKYQNVSISPDALDYNFISKGTKGDLEKLIQFKPFNLEQNIYNLGLGTVDENGRVDFLTVTKNGDRDKILATIAASAYVFSQTYPDRQIFLTGDIPSKTRLYQMAINNAHEELSKTFVIIGLKFNSQEKKYYPSSFEKKVNYDAFLFIRKEENLE